MRLSTLCQEQYHQQDQRRLRSKEVTLLKFTWTASSSFSLSLNILLSSSFSAIMHWMSLTNSSFSSDSCSFRFLKSFSSAFNCSISSKAFLSIYHQLILAGGDCYITDIARLPCCCHSRYGHHYSTSLSL